MIDLCKDCIHKDDICFMLEFPCLEYEPKELDYETKDEKEGEAE